MRLLSGDEMRRLDPLTGGPIVDICFQTCVPGIFAAGNMVHVYDLVDWVTEAGAQAGLSAAQFALRKLKPCGRMVSTETGTCAAWCPTGWILARCARMG